MKYRFIILSIIINIGFSPVVTQLNLTNTVSVVSTYFPTDEWRKTSLEEVGINSLKLAAMEEAIDSSDYGVDSLHIIRNGFLVYEKYYEYYNYSSIHQMSCTTKGITSILIGIANASGYITNLDEPILNIFSDRTFNNTDERKEAITIRHLLKSQCGIQWNEMDVPFFAQTIDTHNYTLFINTSDVFWENWPFNPDFNPRQMMQSPDWIQFVLDRPMVQKPGIGFYYHSGASHLLSAIIKYKTGLNTEVFAKQKLFNPLGITEYLWFNDSMDLTNGFGGLWLTPFDMTKIGYLFLNNGTWNGNQLVPVEWVQESTHQFLIDQQYGYGFQWWSAPPLNLFFATGGGGQYIIIKPDVNLVVAITASKYIEDHFYVFREVFKSYILDSLESEISTTIEETNPPKSSNLPTLFVFLSLGLITLIHQRKRKM
ncbi:MAG: serine hydrolase domain-containing protein [Candidatus Hodarchaeota archaeon]